MRSGRMVALGSMQEVAALQLKELQSPAAAAVQGGAPPLRPACGPAGLLLLRDLQEVLSVAEVTVDMVTDMVEEEGEEEAAAGGVAVAPAAAAGPPGGSSPRLAAARRQRDGGEGVPQPQPPPGAAPASRGGAPPTETAGGLSGGGARPPWPPREAHLVRGARRRSSCEQPVTPRSITSFSVLQASFSTSRAPETDTAAGK